MSDTRDDPLPERRNDPSAEKQDVAAGPTPRPEVPLNGPDAQHVDAGEIPVGSMPFADQLDEEPSDFDRHGGRERRCRVVAIASGKGGVGKSLLAASISIYLAQLNKRVVLLDASFGTSNLHTMLGMEQAEGSLHDFLRNEVKRLGDVVSPTPFEGLGLIAGLRNRLGAANPRPAQKKRLLMQLRSLDADYVVVDGEAGSGFNALDTFLAADVHLVVTQPEPTAIESAFRFIKSAYLRRLRDVRGIGPLLDQAEAEAHCGVPTPQQLSALAQRHDEALVGQLNLVMTTFRPMLVVNNIRTREDFELGPALAAIARRHLGLPVEYIGYVESDDMVWVCVRRRRPLLVEHPEAKVSRDIERIARRVSAYEAEERSARRTMPIPLDNQNHYELLGLHAAASEEEIRRAMRTVKRMYDPQSNAIYGLVPPDEAARFVERVEEAYGTLVDPEKQQAYNQTLFPEGPMEPPPVTEDPIDPEPDIAPEQSQEVQSRPRRDMPAIDEGTEFTGELLRQVREAQGVDLKEIADRTKISITHLLAIESENFASTPAPVYLSGFVKAVARHLKLDPERVAQSYMKRYRAALG